MAKKKIAQPKAAPKKAAGDATGHPRRVLSSPNGSNPGLRQLVLKASRTTSYPKAATNHGLFFPAPLWKKQRHELTKKNGKFRRTHSVTEFEGAHLV
jgi:hypothetical protein